MGLHDAILIKENHIESAGTVTAALHRAFAEHPNVEIEIEVETHEQLEEALAAGVKRVLLDNMSLPQLREAVEINQGRARLEASGGVNLDTVRDIAQTGVDDISVGEITKDIRAIDFSMRFVAEA
jgi:nicotinate-nucleotide pyrophosphorylase (carboxylating)